MFTKQQLSNMLFLDIETVRAWNNYDDIPENIKEAWQHKAKSVRSDDEEVSIEDKFYDKAAIFAEFGKVVCISIGFLYWRNNQVEFKLKSFYGQDEKQLLLEFKNLLDNKFSNWQLCAHNGKEFDFPYLCRRFLLNQIHLPKLLDIQGKKPWEVPFLDTMELWKFGDRKNYTKLELLCQIFNIPTPKDDIDGSMVGKVFWEEEDVERIAIYCEKDVVATAQLMLKYSILALVSSDNIISELNTSS